MPSKSTCYEQQSFYDNWPGCESTATEHFSQPGPTSEEFEPGIRDLTQSTHSETQPEEYPKTCQVC